MTSFRLLWHRVQRYFRHRWFDDQVSRRLDAQAMARLTAAVAKGERHHSGQIRVCVEGGLPTSYLWRGASTRERAITLFGKLRVWDTEHNNGVLIYLVLADRAIEFIADRGLARNVPEATWAAILFNMQSALRNRRYEDALQLAINEVAALLEAHGGGVTSVSNELPDAPVLGPIRY